MRKFFTSCIVICGFSFVFCGFSFALPYRQPPEDSFLGETVLNCDTPNMKVGMKVWAWLEIISSQTYTYLAYQILNNIPPYFSPYISSFSVSKLPGVAAEITGSATSSAGENGWLGIELPNNIDWFALSGQDLIFAGQVSNSGKAGLASDYFEYAILEEQLIGLVDTYVSGAGLVANGKSYGATVVPEPPGINLWSSLILCLFVFLNPSGKSLKRFGRG